jgi:hypothetical protein
MKAGTLTNKQLWLPVLAIGLIIGLVSWDYKQSPTGTANDQIPTDTLPKKKKATEKKVRDLDDVLNELNEVDFNIEMEKAQVELSRALKELDTEKMNLDIQKAMKEIDMTKIKANIERAIKEVDMEKIQKEVNESIAKIDWDKIKVELEQVKNIDFSKMEIELKAAQVEIEKIKPQLEKEMAKVKVDMEKAKVEIEKAKVEMKEYKEFVDGLASDGLINKKENYTISHENGVLTVNGKKVSAQVYTKYSSFLEKHKKFSIEKSDDDFNIDVD